MSFKIFAFLSVAFPLWAMGAPKAPSTEIKYLCTINTVDKSDIANSSKFLLNQWFNQGSLDQNGNATEVLRTTEFSYAIDYFKAGVIELSITRIANGHVVASARAFVPKEAKTVDEITVTTDEAEAGLTTTFFCRPR